MLPLTDGVVAMINLEAQIDGYERLVMSESATIGDRIELIDLIALRGQICGRISDYERMEAAAEQLVREAPSGGAPLLTRARVRARFHRFSDALSDLDGAQRLGVDRAVVDTERANVFQATGRYDDALSIYEETAKGRADFESLGAMATLNAERGKIVAAERLFDESRGRYRGVSPFPKAVLDFRRGHMWLTQGDLYRARTWFESAVCCLPAYAPAQGHLAEVQARLGETEAAVARLLPFAASSDDPEYAASLARIFRQANRTEEAQAWHRKAEARYDELMARHPEAFADHAAEFWLEAGEGERACRFATLNLEVRKTPRARELVRACYARKLNDVQASGLIL